jgi:hypothetical protein
MKFKKASEIETKRFNKPKSLIKIDQTVDNIFDTKLYTNVAIYLMKHGTKGNFKYISTLLNDGTYPASWSIRISFIKDYWELYFAPHPDAEKLNLNIRELFEEMKLPNVEILGNLHVGIIRSENKEVIEFIINFVIKQFADKKLKINIKEPLNKKHTKQICTSPYKLKYKVLEKTQFDSKTYKKYLLMIDILMKQSLEKKEKDEIIKISKILFKEKKIDSSDKKTLNGFIDKHVSQRDKIRVAIKYLSDKGGKDA